ncbi:hypothetical protein [Pseudovibrio exalbescens]|uniref:Uncharacterized protein n=1 Tax=Pseudovibrio exalbescens TaxID=197461 RepID=A0A1U7JCK7_9HYPH|nr:hypothetical protein [Pseudovibrio exalbescens]OKL42424.1 hypothetical protein A3843_17240 [Pseudovibrio exalbescens]
MAKQHGPNLFFPGDDAVSGQFRQLMGQYMDQLNAYQTQSQATPPAGYPGPEELQRLGQHMLAIMQIWEGQQRLAGKGLPLTYDEVRDFWYDAVRIVPDWAWQMGPVSSLLFLGNVTKEHLPEEPRRALEAFLRGFARGRPSPAMSSFLAFNPFLQSQQAFWKSFMS